MCEMFNICVSAQSTAAYTNKNYRFLNFQLLFFSEWLLNGFLVLFGNIFSFRVYTVFQTAQNIQFLLVEQRTSHNAGKLLCLPEFSPSFS